ncbi:MAG TPA: GNAT family N-acetyltransferase [bacterium]|nr:GNAT family N-acetyltransferase [bacterium]HPN43475.1 GNAT family N-acetyltransferase [bacterium]
MAIQIRKASRNDSSLLCSLIQQAFQDVARQFNLTRENCPTHPSFYSQERIQTDLAKGLEFFIIEISSKPVGCVGLEFKNKELGYLIRLAVLNEYRKKGLGKMLVIHCFDYARSRGLARIEIGIISAQKELRTWYEKLGFEFLQETHFKHLPFAVTFMVNHLVQSPKIATPGL